MADGYARRREILAFLVIGALATTRVSATPDALERQVREAESQLAHAVALGDGAAVAMWLTVNYVFVDRTGRVHDRSDDQLATAAALTTACETVRVHGHVAIVIASDEKMRALRVWVHEPGGWRVASAQAVSIAPGSDAPTVPVITRVRADVPALNLTTTSTVADVLRAQDSLDRANAMRDPDTFARLTQRDFVLVTNHGLVRSKDDRVIEERIARFERQPERPMPIRDDVDVRRFGSAAIVIARSWPRTADGDFRAPTRSTRVWLKGTSGWTQIANISTFVLSVGE